MTTDPKINHVLELVSAMERARENRLTDADVELSNKVMAITNFFSGQQPGNSETMDEEWQNALAMFIGLAIGKSHNGNTTQILLELTMFLDKIMSAAF
jgi:hypothetical protein